MNVDIENNWESKWRSIVSNPDGSIDVEQLKKELADFESLIYRMECLTDAVTGGRLSYATYPIQTILQVMKEVKQEEIEFQKREDQADGLCSLCEREFE